MKTPPPEVASDDWERFTVPEKVALYDGYVAYFGRFEVDTARRVVIHLPEADLSRLYIGRREERHFELVADRLAAAPSRTILWGLSVGALAGAESMERFGGCTTERSLVARHSPVRRARGTPPPTSCLPTTSSSACPQHGARWVTARRHRFRDGSAAEAVRGGE